MASGVPRLRFLGWAYLGVMMFALVYLGEHYFVDIAAGIAAAWACWWLGGRVLRAISSVERSAQLRRPGLIARRYRPRFAAPTLDCVCGAVGQSRTHYSAGQRTDSGFRQGHR